MTKTEIDRYFRIVYQMTNGGKYGEICDNCYLPDCVMDQPEQRANCPLCLMMIHQLTERQAENLTVICSGLKPKHARRVAVNLERFNQIGGNNGSRSP